MAHDVRDSPLLSFLQRRSPEYHGKILELREEAARWLAYTTASFTHYTVHTIEHSDEIIRQLSSLLFPSEDPLRPVIDLTAAEAYVLCGSALLHDTGMVVSDSELREVLESEGWATWTRDESSVRRRLGEIQSLRESVEPADQNVRYLIADRQMRYLVLDYVRRSHHHRSAQFLRQNQTALGRFAFDDPILMRTIASVCSAHGVQAYELEDSDEFPEQRDIRGDKVNVRFCALLLRLGDLLDMNYDRACPLLLSAVSPLPAESMAHWSQYQRIVHRVTAPDRIELTAECETQDEHRYLHDWCSWLVREVETARTMMAYASRHAKWKPPSVSISSDGPIVIRPSAAANYIAVDWQLQLDTEAVLSRLIHDVNPEPGAFLRELLQNALDATRCRMYDWMVRTGIEPPAYPNQADEDLRKQFPVRVTHTTRTLFDEMSQQDELRDVVIVEDLGIGMDRDTIIKYLLQVGRSYYTSDEFLRRYPFVPTSKFGVGFLSVFDTADEVRVETLRAGDASDHGVALTLRGPRSYVLTEQISRPHPGTRVEVTLRKRMNLDLHVLARQWCRRVEFPVEVTTDSETTIIRSEKATDFCYEEPSAIDKGETHGVRAFRVEASGVDGEIYVFFRRNAVGESWTDYTWATYTYPMQHPSARRPRVPHSLVCLHGLALSSGSEYDNRGLGVRIDYRRTLEGISLSRQQVRSLPGLGFGLRDTIVQRRLVEILQEHLEESGFAKGIRSWRYKQRLIDWGGFHHFWLDEPEMVRTFVHGHEEMQSIRDVSGAESLAIVLRSHPSEKTDDPPPYEGTTALWAPDIGYLAGATRKHVLHDRAITRVEWANEHRVVIWDRAQPRSRISFGWGAQTGDVVPISGDEVAFPAHTAFNETYDHAVLNADHEFVRWLCAVREAANADPPRVPPEQWEALAELLASPIWHGGLDVDRLNDFLKRWRADDAAELRPPDQSLTAQDFLVG